MCVTCVMCDVMCDVTCDVCDVCDGLVVRVIRTGLHLGNAISRERLRVVRVNGTAALREHVCVRPWPSLAQLSAVPKISRPPFSKVSNLVRITRTTSRRV